MTDFRLIVGLGNPGPRHMHNRHNIGFQTLDALSKAYRLTFSRTEHHAETIHGTIDAQRVILAKPQTWMNHSGQAIGALSRFYKIPPGDILVIYDDLDIPLGTLRYRQQGSSGGHRGVQSTIEHLGTDAFPRLRLGIGRPPGKMDPAAYVLQNFSEEEKTLVWEVQRTACALVEDWIQNNPDLQRQGMTWRVETAS